MSTQQHITHTEIQAKRIGFDRAVEEVVSLFEDADEKIALEMNSYSTSLSAALSFLLDELRKESAAPLKNLHSAESNASLVLRAVERGLISSRTMHKPSNTKASFSPMMSLYRSIAPQWQSPPLSAGGSGTIIRSSEFPVEIEIANIRRALEKQNPGNGGKNGTKSLTEGDEQSADELMATRNWFLASLRPIPLRGMPKPDSAEFLSIPRMGKEGCAIMAFRRPWGMCTDPQTGNLYVTDQWNGRLCVMKPNFEWVTTVGSTGSGPSQMDCPCGVAMDFAGNICVVDYSNRRICVLRNTGSAQSPTLCVVRILKEPFSNPVNVAIDRFGTAYVTDLGHHGVVTVDLRSAIQTDTEQGDPPEPVVGRLAPPPKISGDFPYSVCVDDNDRVLVCYRGGEQIYAYCARTKALLQEIPVEKTSQGYPTYMTRGPHGGFAISDERLNIVHLYSATGVKIWSFPFSTPVGITFGLDGSLYVNECGQHKLCRV
eukprot:TRINITY_DN2319_c0_g3_i1.p1 TRINITY_DN2319_c0_g3~~TRINITY_DN2319_c0_g3_i1.p1  ORF type:complete len:486 (-),score=93.70 TRINITY_DN2319_c0_g3_i1:173-1630(-)